MGVFVKKKSILGNETLFWESTKGNKSKAEKFGTGEVCKLNQIHVNMYVLPFRIRNFYSTAWMNLVT